MEHNYLNIISKEFNLECVYFFGNSNSVNDIDLIIVSDSFIGISLSKRKRLIKKNNKKLDPICLTKKEFEKLRLSESSLWNELLNNGKLIYGLEKRYN